MSKVKRVVPYIAATGLLIASACLIKKKISVKNVRVEEGKEEELKSIPEGERNYIKLR